MILDQGINTLHVAPTKTDLALAGMQPEGWGCAALMLCGLAGCAADRFAGVDLRPGGAPPDVQALARSSHGGDKQAQLVLAGRLERGDGLLRNSDAAKQLYRAVA